ncbi:MAG: thermonuclease family protein [Pseudomonadota bacterium]
MWRRARGRRRRPWWLALLLGLVLSVESGLASFVVSSAKAALFLPSPCQPGRVIDGDTAWLTCEARGTQKVRLTGFDAPEMNGACLSESARAVQSKLTLQWLLWRAGTIEARFEGTDRYGRALASVTLDGQPLAQTMIAGGHGRAYQGGTRAGWCS